MITTELRKLADTITKMADKSEAMKIAAIDEETKNVHRASVIAYLECVSLIYTRILENQTNN